MQQQLHDYIMSILNFHPQSQCSILYYSTERERQRKRETEKQRLSEVMTHAMRMEGTDVTSARPQYAAIIYTTK